MTIALSVSRLKASAGSGNASVATVQVLRAPGASTIKVNTVSGIPTNFIGSMGTPHTFTDPVTSEVITIISEATTIDFSGHVDTGDLIIDSLAPGYTDSLGSKVGDIVIIKPTTAYADNLAGGLASILNEDFSMKTAAVLAALNSSSLNGFLPLGSVPTTVTANGNRVYTLVFNGIDHTTTMSAGMRGRTQRTVSAGVQCTSLNGTNQYFNKTTPAGMTWTDDMTAGAWVKLNSYVNATILSRYNGTSGFTLDITALGQVRLIGYNASAANYSLVQSYPSVPLNKWIHIAAQLDMSAFTATTTTSYVMFDGIDVPATVSRAGTNPTALVQAGNLEIGSQNGGLVPFNGKIAQAFIASAKITQANIVTLHSQNLTAALITTNSIASAYSFSNSITDLNTTTANNLTAQNSAVATNADSPFGCQADGTVSATLDYFILNKISISGGNTTMIVQVPEGGTIPTSGGVTAVSYSPNEAPYGFPGSKDKWRIEADYAQAISISIGATGAWVSGAAGYLLKKPIGKFNVGWQGSLEYSSGTLTAGLAARATLYDSTNSLPVYGTSMRWGHGAISSNYVQLSSRGETCPVTEPATNYTVAVWAENGASMSYSTIGYTMGLVLFADNAYL